MWYEEEGRPEFCVKTQTFSFDVECKRIGYDASKMIRRKDFYRFAEVLVPKIKQINLQGKLDVVLNDRLHASDQFLLREISTLVNFSLGVYPLLKNQTKNNSN